MTDWRDYLTQEETDKLRFHLNRREDLKRGAKQHTRMIKSLTMRGIRRRQEGETA